MKRVHYDFHIHSCLSPCGDLDMTPNNIVNMAKLLGYDMIALTDHNTCLNTPAAVKAGEQIGLPVIPGMELCTEEEAHVVCLFPTVEDALCFDQLVREKRLPFPNDPEIFGRQVIMDENDKEVGEEENLLINAVQISVNEVLELARSCHGTAFPAHVDKNAYSVIASLGFIPPEAGFQTIEISARGDVSKLIQTNPEINGKILLLDSDAHYLENMPDIGPWIELPEVTAACAVAALDGKFGVNWGRSEA